jgi:hypothetical protein
VFGLRLGYQICIILQVGPVRLTPLSAPLSAVIRRYPRHPLEGNAMAFDEEGFSRDQEQDTLLVLFDDYEVHRNET